MNQRFHENALALTLIGLVALAFFTWLATQAAQVVDAIDKASKVVLP